MSSASMIAWMPLHVTKRSTMESLLTQGSATRCPTGHDGAQERDEVLAGTFFTGDNLADKLGFRAGLPAGDLRHGQLARARAGSDIHITAVFDRGISVDVEYRQKVAIADVGRHPALRARHRHARAGRQRTSYRSASRPWPTIGRWARHSRRARRQHSRHSHFPTTTSVGGRICVSRACQAQQQLAMLAIRSVHRDLPVFQNL